MSPEYKGRQAPRFDVEKIVRLHREAVQAVRTLHGQPHILVDEPTVVQAQNGQRKGMLGTVAMWTHVHGVYGGGFRIKWTTEALHFSAWNDDPNATLVRSEMTFRAVPAYDFLRIGLLGVRLL